MTYIRAWMNLKFGQIRPLFSMATDRVIMAKTVSQLFLGCFSYLQIIMICMRTRRSSKFGQIRLLTAELAALECLKNPHRLIMGKMVLPLFLSYS